MTDPQQLLTEARLLIEKLEALLDSEYFDHPIGGRLPKAGSAKRIVHLKKLIRGRAYRRLARRAYAAGMPLPISFAMWVINHRDSTSI